MPRNCRDQSSRGLLRPANELLVAESEDGPIRGREERVAATVHPSLAHIGMECVTIGLNDNPALDHEVDSPDPVETDLWDAPQTEIAYEETRQGLETGFCARVGQAHDNSGPCGVLANQREVGVIHESQVPRAIEGSDCSGHGQATCRLDECIDEVDLTEIRGADQGLPMTDDGSRPLWSVSEMHVEGVVREDPDSENSHQRGTRESPTKTRGALNVGMTTGRGVDATTKAQNRSGGDLPRQGAIGDACTSELPPGNQVVVEKHSECLLSTAS